MERWLSLSANHNEKGKRMAAIENRPRAATNQVLLSETIAGPGASRDDERDRRVRRWQGYLAQRGYYRGAIDGLFGPATADATRTFQEKYRRGIWGRRLAPHWGALDKATACFACYPDGRPFSFDPLFQIGPDKTGDLREARPYFVVPVDETPDVLLSTRERIVRWATQATQSKGPITDVYLLSHGWHRNFYGAVAAYDQLLSRTSLLLHRRRIETGEGYHPLFLTLHWHSDPGQDGWVDRSGRRHKDGFLDNAERVFERPSAEEERSANPPNRFTDVFEDVFQWCSRLSAPDTQALEDPELADKAHELAGRLDRFRLREATDAEASDKVAAAWACYHRAPVKRFLLDQPERPGRFVLFPTALMDTGKFLLGMIGVTAAAGLLFRFSGRVPLLSPALRWLGVQWERLVGWLLDFGFLQGPATVAAFLLVYAGLSGLAWGYLRYKARRNVPDEQKPRHGVPIVRLLAWLLLEIPSALPLLVHLFFTYFLGGVWLRARYGILKSLGFRKPKMYASGLFDERLGDRDTPITSQNSALIGLDRRGMRRIRGWHPRYYLATWARGPIRLLRQGMARQHDQQGLVDVLDNQFAFWEMQVAGAGAGRNAARFLADLFPQLNDALDGRAPDGSRVQPWRPRIHLLGHSFGGLVVANTARHLELDPECRRVIRQIHSICLLQAAIASTWFEEEDWIQSFVTGGLGCIYSAYDTANGFYYPVANNARLASGFVGLYRVGDGSVEATLPRHDGQGAEVDAGLFTSLVSSPDLNALLTDRYPGHTGPWFVNLDASRLIYEGPIATGGGHSDVYKDDVAHLCWAVTRLTPRPAAPVPPVGVVDTGAATPSVPSDRAAIGSGGASDEP
jgi:hypothetical protein